MNKAEFNRAFAIADNRSIDLSHVDDTILDGYGLRDFQPVVTTVEAVARMMRWQAWDFYKGWLSDELTDIRNTMRKKVTICN